MYEDKLELGEEDKSGCDASIVGRAIMRRVLAKLAFMAMQHLDRTKQTKIDQVLTN